MPYTPERASRAGLRQDWRQGALFAIAGMVLWQVAGCSVSSEGLLSDVAGNSGAAASGGGAGGGEMGGDGGTSNPTGGTAQGGAGQGGLVGGGGSGGLAGGAGGMRQGGAGGVRQGGASGSGGVAGGTAGMGGTAGAAGGGAGGSGNLGGRGTLNAPITEGTVTCGAKTCDLSEALCCQTDVSKTSCTLGQQCDGGTTRTCDGPEDCNGSQVCCGRDRDSGYSAGCTPIGNCPTQMPGWAMFCHNNTQCHNMEVCCPTAWTETTVGTCRVSCLIVTPL